MGDYQLICNERGLGELMQNSKGFRIKEADLEVGIGIYTETGDNYYFIRVELCNNLFKKCFLFESQVRNLNYFNLGYEFFV